MAAVAVAVAAAAAVERAWFTQMQLMPKILKLPVRWRLQAMSRRIPRRWSGFGWHSQSSLVARATRRLLSGLLGALHPLARSGRA